MRRTCSLSGAIKAVEREATRSVGAAAGRLCPPPCPALPALVSFFLIISGNCSRLSFVQGAYESSNFLLKLFSNEIVEKNSVPYVTEGITIEYHSKEKNGADSTPPA